MEKDDPCVKGSKAAVQTNVRLYQQGILQSRALLQGMFYRGYTV